MFEQISLQRYKLRVLKILPLQARELSLGLAPLGCWPVLLLELGYAVARSR